MEDSNLSEFGIVGLGVMASAYARNLYSRGFRVSVWTRSRKEIDNFNEKLNQQPKSSGLVPDSINLTNVKCYMDLDEFVSSLKTPKMILMLITAGEAVDSVLDKLILLLDKHDMVIDGGNEWYKNTERRILRCKQSGIRYSGMGISGGERGALTHPCLMFGGNLEDYNELKRILSQVDTDFYVGPGSSGHYVKMVHNGMEYALMQVISELYKLMKCENMMSNSDIASVFNAWHSENYSYLLQITQMILQVKEGNEHLLDKILPCVSSNGTGKWTVQDAFDRAVPVPSIAISVDMRCFSNLSQHSNIPNTNNVGERVEKYKIDELKLTYICTAISIFSQGFHLVSEASREFGWDLNLSRLANIWSKNAIISCDLLNEISKSFKETDRMLPFHSKFNGILKDSMKTWKDVVKRCLENDIPVPGIATSLQYIQILFNKHEGYNLIQAQRDCFGSHTFRRVDMLGNHHYNWWNNE
ncbi:6-phosphogluconate dehydrogenase domain protein [Theileria parva strain Muguga]|uniref:6-phosphogluconate dehydrogenase domain protein n=1 Tax=Theileria parva strain Muguga TaxID=333668 RepID=UPI001C61F0DD|nr:6-phosphogluconate dehydrogenase domain protein [Theileria parva strain Muguga]EAN33437.2 6-phosphogluconate dehydrogenase domain protein [Theileria parva strain Muguga]